MPLHFPEDAFPLHALLEDAKRLVDVACSDEYLKSASLLAVSGADLSVHG
jgi:hypothetical protein